MRKGVLAFAFLALIVVSIGFSSAFSWNDVVGKITGKVTSSTCTDSDGGIYYDSRGTLTSQGNSYTDYCYEYTTGQGVRSSNVYEYYCSDDGWPKVVLTGCADGCLEGRCLPRNYVPEQQNTQQTTATPSPPRQCTDSDGLNYEVKGNVNIGGDVYNDACYSSSALIEYTCGDGEVSKKTHDCSPGSCSDGKCVSATQSAAPNPAGTTQYTPQTSSGTPPVSSQPLPPPEQPQANAELQFASSISTGKELAKYEFNVSLGRDSSGNSFHAPPIGNIQLASEGIGGSSALIDGGYLNASRFSWNSQGPVTVTFWVKVLENKNDMAIFSVGNADSPARFQAGFSASDGKIYWDYGSDYEGSGKVSADFRPYLGKWTYVTLVSKGTQIFSNGFAAVYINGGLAASDRLSNSPSDVNGESFPLYGLTIGRACSSSCPLLPAERISICYEHDSAACNNYKGSLDEFAIYGKVLSESEVKASYESQKALLVDASKTSRGKYAKQSESSTPDDKSSFVEVVDEGRAVGQNFAVASLGNCEDSDGGINLNEAGHTSVYTSFFGFFKKLKTFDDGCYSNTGLYEYSCINGGKTPENYECQDGFVCSAGACKNSDSF